jgi:glycosyltransferase involved in cell wall biosynthesis
VRVLMLAQWYPPIVGGEELHVASLSAELAARGHEVTVATLSQPGLPDDELDGKVRVVRLAGTLQRFPGLFADSGRRSAAPIAEPRLSLGIDRLTGRFRPDILHAHNWLVHAALPVRAARGIPLVQTLHDFSLVCAVKVLLRKGIDCSGPSPLKCLACSASHYGPVKGPITAVANWSDSLAQRRLVDAFIAVSRAVAEGNEVTSHRHAVIPNFVPDEPELPPDADGYRSRLPDEPYVLFAGALGRLKGVHVLLEAWRSDPRLPRLVLLGYPMRETEELLRDVPRNVSVLGQWPHAAVEVAWQGALMGIVPSICREACPTVVLEAMRAGRPVVATDLGGTSDLVENGRTGILVPPNDVRALARAVRHIAGDARLAAEMRRRAAMRGVAFTAAAVVPRIESLYQEVLDMRRSTPGAA